MQPATSSNSDIHLQTVPGSYTHTHTHTHTHIYIYIIHNKNSTGLFNLVAWNIDLSLDFSIANTVTLITFLPIVFLKSFFSAYLSLCLSRLLFKG